MWKFLIRKSEWGRDAFDPLLDSSRDALSPSDADARQSDAGDTTPDADAHLAAHRSADRTAAATSSPGLPS